MELAILVGTRPEIIKMSPVMRACEARGVDYTLIDTKQHYSDNMSSAFYQDLGLHPPDYTLMTQPGSHGVQLASMLTQLEDILQPERFAALLVQGDTNSVLAGALMASRGGIPVAHVEAGLRSNDRTMPEEINRIMVDHISDYLFATSDETVRNLLREGISEDSVHNVGNTIVDATFRGVKLAQKQPVLKLNLPSDYLLLTLHRPANVDNAETFREILEGIKAVMIEHELSVVFPVHPRTRQQIARFGLSIPGTMRLVEPLGYLDFLRAESGARLIMSDSGGVQEEACILHIPCVTLRNNTERPETITVGANTLGGMDKKHITQAARTMLAAPKDWKIPYGDGTAGAQIVNILTAAFKPIDTQLIAETARR